MVFEILRIGKENAIQSEYLRQILRFKSVRELQKQIQAERLQGKVILSCSHAGSNSGRERVFEAVGR